MNNLRILSIILTAPIWLLSGFFIALVLIPLWIVIYFVAICEYGFTGRWDL